MARHKLPEGFQDQPVQILYVTDVKFRGVQCVQSRRRRSPSLVMAIDRKVQKKSENLSFTAYDARRMAETVMAVLQSDGGTKRRAGHAAQAEGQPLSTAVAGVGGADGDPTINHIRQELYALGRTEAMRQLESVEPDLYVAITHAAVRAISPLESMHVDEEMVDHVYNSVIWGALVAVEAVRRASLDLWKDAWDH